MKFKLFIAANIFLLASCGKCVEKCSKSKKQEAAAPAPATQHQKVSYALGSMIANDLKRNGLDSLDINSFARAFNVVYGKDTALYSEAEIRNTMELFSQQMRMKQEIQKQIEIDSATAEGKKFLAQNKMNTGVITTPSGLQYKIVKPGSGNYPLASDQVTVHYEGKLLDGRVFDSSINRGEPATFGLNQVIRGWTEGLQHINEGGEIELYIPYDLAYGEQGAGGMIPPYATLIFKVQLIKIEKALEHGPGDGHNH
ncbi:MAG: FKBP-type peptidyl-prolyl cis-trans isomerase [Flavobacteriales bacterium]